MKIVYLDKSGTGSIDKRQLVYLVYFYIYSLQS